MVVAVFRWYKYDDSAVAPISEASVCTDAAYMLFYTSVDFADALPSFK